jgi:Mrp family chromosome partitioning ATPase/capsular polysaccharide biosynthesis protein
VDPPQTELKERVVTLRHHWKLIAAAAVVTTLGALLYSFRGQPTYTASSRVVVRPVLVQGTLTPQDVSGSLEDPFGLSDLIPTQVLLVEGQDVANRVAQLLPPRVLQHSSVSASAISDDVLEIDVSAPTARKATRLANAYAAAFLDVRRGIVRTAFLNAATDLGRKISALTARSQKVQAMLDGSLRSELPRSGLEAEMRSLSDTIASLSTELHQRQLDADSVTGGGAIVQGALGAAPSGASPVRNATVGLFLGLLLGLGLAILRSNADRRVVSLDSAAQATSAEVIASIPNTSTWAKRTKAEVRIHVQPDRRTLPGSNAGPTGVAVAQTRFSLDVVSSLSGLRQTLVLRGLGSEIRRLVLVSADPGEGTELACAGVAWACATAGLRTVAIDGATSLADRHPLFGVRGGYGLAEALSGKIRVTNALLPTSVPNLRMLPAGLPQHRHDDALASAQPDLVFNSLARATDVFVIRSPAMSSGGDAMAWASRADGILLVLRAGATRPGAARRASQRLQSLAPPLLGVILTHARSSDSTGGVPETLPLSGPGSHPDGNGQVHLMDQSQPNGSEPASAQAARSRRTPATRRRRH